jgi:4-amino-4-deoxy-L-arabinose transferase-like glycosyltransferase
MKRFITIFYTAPLFWISLLWAGFTACVIQWRPVLSFFESRIMTMAQEMAVSHDYLVPTFHFEFYAHEPPLLLWLINAAWSLWGTNRVVTTLLVSVISLGCFIWINILTKTWWPHARFRRHHVLWLSFGALLFPLYGTIIAPDFLMVFFMLMGFFMLWHAGSGKAHFFLWYGVCVALGLLAKGPIMLLHVVPVGLLAPLWIKERTTPWLRWYAGFFGGLFMGIIMALCWAFPTAIQSGLPYPVLSIPIVTTITQLKQTLMIYGISLVLITIPWIFYPKIAQRFAVLRYFTNEAPTLFLLCWIGGTLLLLPFLRHLVWQDIIPLWPAFALLAARLIDHVAPTDRDLKFMFAPFFIVALLWSCVASLVALGHYTLPPLWRDFIQMHWSWPLAYGLGIIGLFMMAYRAQRLFPALALAMLLTVTILHASAAQNGFKHLQADNIKQIQKKPL